MELEGFQSLPVNEIRRLVQNAGVKVCGIEPEGTRRWFLLESGLHNAPDYLGGYIEAATQRHAGLFKMIFDHGVPTVVSPITYAFMLKRTPDYIEKLIRATHRMTTHPTFVSLYHEYDVRVRFYGDYRALFTRHNCSDVADLFDQLMADTQDHKSHCLLLGVYEKDAMETIAGLSIQHFQQVGSVPNRSELIEMYYGAPISPLDFYIGYDRYSNEDMPLLCSGETDLFFTLAPSYSITEPQFRAMLHAHLYAPLNYVHDYTLSDPAEWETAQRDYLENRGRTFRVAVQPLAGKVALSRSI